MNKTNSSNSSSAPFSGKSTAGRPQPYELLDSGNYLKLEQAGEYRIVRPALNACWKPTLPEREWQEIDAAFLRDASGHGKWVTHRRSLPERWELTWGGFRLLVKPTSFGHLGFFAEQYANWDFFRKVIPTLGVPDTVKTLNLFAYSGIGSMAMAEAGAQVCHLDAARGMVEWGQFNQTQNQDQVPDRIRWIVDDVVKFCKRELRRGNFYQGIALDPPSFGRGTQGQTWKIEDQIGELLQMCRDLIAPEKPFFITLSCHSTGFTPIGLARILEQNFGTGHTIDCREMSIPERSGKVLPAGITATLIGHKK